MKIIKTTGSIPLGELHNFLEEEINPEFQKRRQVGLAFSFREMEEGVELYNSDLYDNYLFRIEQHENALHILKSEHYTDDVNVLTLEDILNDLLTEFLGRRNIRFIGEGS